MRRCLPLLVLISSAVLLSCRGAPPAPARTSDGALVEVAADELPAFSDDLDWAGLDDAIGHSLDALARIAAADPGRAMMFGRERVPLARLQATLTRFREVAGAHPAPAALQDLIRREFRVFRSTGDGRGEVLFTGYFLPELHGSLARDAQHPVPLHRPPDDLVVARVKDFPAALSSDVVGRVVAGRLVPYPTRAEIASAGLTGSELCWVDSPLDAFFAEIQGSAVVRLADGTSRVATYAGGNGHRYEAIGAELVRRGALRRGEVSMRSIREWLLAHPGERDGVLATNPSYVFFRFADAATGSMGVPVTPDRTIAADARVFPKGGLAFVETERPLDAAPDASFRPFSRFVLDQDAGGAIRTSARIDLYFGSGAYAESAAGRMQQRGRLYYLLLR